jgi:symplekin
MQVGFITLRGLVNQRPAMRAEALNILLELTTHADKRVRGAAINTVKIWVPQYQPMDSMIREFALQMLRKLQAPTAKKIKASEGEVSVTVDGAPEKSDAPAEDTEMAASEAPAVTPVPEAESKEKEESAEEIEDNQPLVQTPYLPERIELPAQKDQVLQHLELMFALSVKVPEFLDQ